MINKNNIKVISIVKQYGKGEIKKILKKEKSILAYNSIGNFELKEKEYRICKMFDELYTYEEVLKEALKLKLIKKEEQFQIIYNMLIEKNMLIEFDISSPESSFIKNIIIKRNGLAIGKTEDNRWVVGYHDNKLSEDGMIALSGKEEYRVWMCANGTTNVKDILYRIGSKMNNQNDEHASVLLEKHLFKFLKLGIWELEYSKNNESLDIEYSEDDKDIFDIKNLRENSLLIPVGFELGNLNTTKDEYWISRGNKWIALKGEEYNLWKRLNKSVMKLGQLQFEYCKPQEEIIHEYIEPMLDKKLIMLWDAKLLYDSKIVRVCSQGEGIVSNSNKLSCKFKSNIDLGYEPEVSEFSHELWKTISGDKSIADIVKAMYKIYENESTYEEVQERVVENIRALKSLGLVKIDVL